MIRRSLTGRYLGMLMLALMSVAEPATAAKLESQAQVSFRAPHRDYQRSASKLNIYVERSLIEGDSKLATAARNKLEHSLDEIFAALPAVPARRLKEIRFYLLWGEAAPQGGLDSGMSYFRPGEPGNYPHLDPDWNHVVVIYSAANLMYLDSLWTRKALMHELAHAWHIINWPEQHPPISAAYLAAKNGGLYKYVKDKKGKVIAEAYAVHNQLEYFAELSAMYFVGGNYFPFDRNGIARHDPGGERMVRQLWGD